MADGKSAPGMVFALGVPFELRAVKVHVAQLAGAVALGLIVEMRRCRDCRSRRRPSRPWPARAPRTRPPRRSCFRWCRTTSSFPDTRAPRMTRAIPTGDEVKPTGMLGPASLNGWTMSPVRRWNRLMSPHGVFHVPKSAASLSDAAASDCSSCSPARLRDVVFRRHPASSALAAHAPAHILAPEHRQRRRHRCRAPAQIPLAQQGDLIGQFRFQRIAGAGARPRP